MYGWYQVWFRIELKHSGKILAANTQKFFSDGSSNTYHVFFDHPVQIEVINCVHGIVYDE